MALNIDSHSLSRDSLPKMGEKCGTTPNHYYTLDIFVFLMCRNDQNSRWTMLQECKTQVDRKREKTHELAGMGAVGSCDAPPLPASFIATVSKIAATLAAVLAEVSMKSIEFLRGRSPGMSLREHPDKV